MDISLMPPFKEVFKKWSHLGVSAPYFLEEDWAFGSIFLRYNGSGL